MAGVVAVIGPERRIELNSFDIDAWNLLLREAQTRPIDQTRSFYEKLVIQFPNAGRYWKAFIEHELRGKNFENVEKLFTGCLVKVLNIDLWKCYLFYVRETKGHLPSFREKMAQAYDFALDKVGLDMLSYTIYAEYISFLKTVPAVGQYAENQKISAVRKVFQRGVVTPMLNIEQLWAEYCSFEKSVNATLAEKLIAEKNRDYQTARRLSRQLEQITRGINRQAVSVPPRGSAAELKQIELWKKYIQWEKSNPAQTEDYAHYTKRVIYTYEQTLLCLGYHPDVWYECSLFQHDAAKILIEKGDMKTSNALLDEASALFERAITTLLKDNQLLYFAYADFEEERMKYANVSVIYDRFIAIPTVDPTLAYIQLMKFMRRTQGVKAGRTAFKRAREDERTRFHVYIAAALMEYYCSKDANVAMRIFDLGLKAFGDEPEYALAYVDFLSHLNEDNNTRVVFERILTSGTMPAEKSVAIWDRYLEFESQVGDLPSILKVDKRRREALQTEYINAQTLLLIDRYKFIDLIPCSSDQLKLLGYQQRQLRYFGSSNSITHSTSDRTNTQNGQNVRGGTGTSGGSTGAQAGNSSTAGTTGIEIAGYPHPDIDQMIPFKPKIITTTSYHPVPGGIYPPPPAVAALMQMLPPPWAFNGPFVIVDALMDTIRRYLPRTNTEMIDAANTEKPTIETDVIYGSHRVDDIKKEFNQLLATTPDPSQMLMMLSDSNQSSSTIAGSGTKRRRYGDGGDSDDDDQNIQSTSSKDIYRIRMNRRAP